MPTITIPITAPTFGAVQKEYVINGTLRLPSIINADVRMNSATLYFGPARLYIPSVYLVLAAGDTHMTSVGINNGIADSTLRDRTVGMAAIRTGNDHLLKVNGRAVKITVKSTFNTTANALDRPRAGDMILTIDYTVLQSSLGLSTTNVDAGQPITANITSGSSAYSHRMTWQFGLQTQVDTLAAGVSSKAFTPPLAWLSQIPNTTSGLASCTLETISGATAIGSETKYFNIDCPAFVVPKASLNAAKVQGGVPTGWGSIYVQGHSGANLTGTAAGIYDSTITSWQISGDGRTASGTGAAGLTLAITKLSGSGNVQFTVSVTDSRGRTAQGSVTIAVIPCQSPTISDTIEGRSNQAGAAAEDGAYASCGVVYTYSGVSSKNSVTVTIAYRARGTTAWTQAYTGALASGVARVIGGSFESVKYYDVRYVVTDALGAAATTESLISSADCFVDRVPGMNQLGLFGYVPGDADNNTLYLADDSAIRIGDVDINGSAISIGEVKIGESTISIGDTSILNFHTNPNLLINPEFRVWQRGTDLSFTQNGYAADRWRVWPSSGSCQVLRWNDNGGMGLFATNIPSSQYVNIEQYIEDKTIIGQTLTMSIDMQTLTGSTTFVLKASGISAAITAPDGLSMLYVTVNPNGYPMVVIKIMGGTTRSVNWVKLEHGSIATPHVPRPIAQEYNMCRRYAQVLHLLLGTPLGSTTRQFVQLPEIMRVPPTYITWAMSGGGAATLSALSSYDMDAACPSGYVDWTVFLDAEIY